MSKTAITNTGRNYFVKQLSDKKPIILDKFIFANITGINGNSDVDLNTTISDDSVVYSAPITQAGLIGESAVAYSIVLDSQTGDFDFNVVGLMNAETNTLCMVMHCDITHKVKNNGTLQGNSLTQTLWLEIDNASQSTGITINAETWQIDYSQRMIGEDERIRLSNFDIYDRLAIHKGIDITKTGKNSYTISTGLVYIAGLRVHVDIPLNITASPGQSIYIDAWLQGSVTGAWTTKFNALSGTNYTDYKNGIFEHYVEPIATIDINGNLIVLATAKMFVTTEDLATTKKIGIVKLSSDINSDSETEAATLKSVKAVMNFIKDKSRWYSKAIGEIVAFDDIDIPPTDLLDCRYIKLSANDIYNADILTSQVVSGTAPLITATGIISLTGSKLNGITINLINTENRYIVANTTANKLRDDAIQNIKGDVGTGIDIYQGTGLTGPFYRNGAMGSAINQPGALLSYWVMFDLSRSNRTDTSTHGRDISKTFYMRIL